MNEKIETKISKKFKIVISLCAVAIMIFSFLVGYFTHYLMQGEKINSIIWLIKQIEGNYYFDEGDGKIKTFTTEDYADAIVKNLLDKYSDYYTKDEYIDVISTSKGNSYGIGVSFLKTATDNTIFKVSGNSPAERAGLRDGDKIIAGEVGGVKTQLNNKEEIFEFLGGILEDVSFSLDCLRKGETFSVTLKREAFIESFVFYSDSEKSLRFQAEGNMPLQKVEGSENIPSLSSSTAYIALSSFDGGAVEQIGWAMEYASLRGKSKIILDLRSNGGGYMSVLSGVASYFTYSEQARYPVIAVAVNKSGTVQNFTSSGDNFNRNIEKICVLANENTASASECLIGAMLHYGKAFNENYLVIEKNDQGIAKTYGKGIMQTTYPNVLTGQAVKMTTAFIYQPDGRVSIHGVGFIPLNENAVEKGEGIARAIEILQ